MYIIFISYGSVMFICKERGKICKYLYNFYYSLLSELSYTPCISYVRNIGTSHV